MFFNLYRFYVFPLVGSHHVKYIDSLFETLEEVFDEFHGERHGRRYAPKHTCTLQSCVDELVQTAAAMKCRGVDERCRLWFIEADTPIFEFLRRFLFAHFEFWSHSCAALWTDLCYKNRTEKNPITCLCWKKVDCLFSCVSRNFWAQEQLISRRKQTMCGKIVRHML